MNISSTTGRAAHALKRQRLGRLAAAGVVTVALIGLLCICWPGEGALSAQEEDSTPSLSRPLFAGWIQPGHSDFGRPGHQAMPSTGPQPSWVLEKQAPIIDQSELASQAVAQSFLQQQKPAPVARDTEPHEPHLPALQLQAHAEPLRPSLLDTLGATSTR